MSASERVSGFNRLALSPMKLSAFLVAFVWGVTSFGFESSAFDEKGNFMNGGGTGALSCPEFLNAMATARQKGGVQSASGVWEIDGYANYVLGFQTGFNSEADGVYDIFSSFGLSPARKALYAIEPWCASHPDKRFSDAVLALANTLRTKQD